MRGRNRLAPCRSGASLHRGWLAAALLVLVAVGGAGCQRQGGHLAAREDKLVVFAAASLREAFTAIGDDLKRGRPGVEIVFNFAGTQELRAQLQHGAGADVFASADRRHMDELVAASEVASPTIFARNELVVVVAKDSGAAALENFADLPNASRIVIGAPEVPIGRYTSEILDRSAARFGADFRARVQAKVVSRELNVRQVLAKVSLGEAQAGFIYRTDAQQALDRVTVLPIPPEVNVIAEYPIAIVTKAAHPVLARAWVDKVLSDAGQRQLRNAGFLGPSAPASRSSP